MKLTEEQKKIVVEKLSYFLSTSCDACSGHKWLLNDTIFELREFERGNLIIGGKSSIFPVLTVTCGSCGRTHFFNAISLGLIEKNNGEKN